MTDLLHFFRWQDALDIFILTFVFYRLFLSLRRTRALRMILALIALLLFYFVIQWIDLPLIARGFQSLWAVILFVLVVIFQQEIRGALGSITLPSFLFGRPSAERLASKSMERMVEATFRMRAQRIGGLIVIQRKDDLDEFIHEKTLLDAQINEDLLISIFNTHSPLHDGAVIIQGDRIRYAAAVLPVSPSTSLPREWGTRHRAGIGITELSDAESIIISEERGEVLFGYQGKAKKEEEREDLKRSLAELPFQEKERDHKKRWPKGIGADLPAKVLILFFVCLLWFFVVGIRQGEIGFSIPIEYYSTPSNLEIIGDPPREISVRLRGSQRLLSSLSSERLRARIDLTGGHSGVNQVYLSETNVNVPSGITVSHFYPEKVRVQLAEILKSNRK
jgi:diadenylate cyclase